MSELYNLLEKLIACKSISPFEANSLEVIKDFISNLNIQFLRLDKNHTANLLAVYGDLSQPIVAFAGHVDVVPAGNISMWHSDPFSLYEKNGKFFGRGIADMKGAIVSFLIALKKIIGLYEKLNYTILLLLTSDEETSGNDGMPVLVEYLKNAGVTIQQCILGEPTAITTVGDTIKIGRRGSLNVEFVIHGIQGHVAYPQDTDNPIIKALPLLKELSELHLDNGTEYFQASKLQISNINAGLGVHNVIPRQLHGKLNIRYCDLWTFDTLKEHLEAIFNKNLSQKDCQVTWINSAQPFITKPSPFIKLVQNSIKKVTNLNAELSTSGGTSDARHIIKITKELVELGLNNSTIHQINECVGKKEIYYLSDIYFDILKQLHEETHSQENR